MKYQPFALGAILREWLCQNDIEPEFPSARRNDGSATAQSGLRTSAAQTPRWPPTTSRSGDDEHHSLEDEVRVVANQEAVSRHDARPVIAVGVKERGDDG